MARTVYVTTELMGGGVGLDGINGNVLVKGDVAFFVNPGTTIAGHEGNYYGVLVATTRNSTDEPPEIVNPDSNPGSWNWERMMPLMPVFHTTGRTATLPNYGVQVIRTTTTGVHVMRRPRRGAYKKLIFATTSKVHVRLSTGIVCTIKLGGVKAGSTVGVIQNSSKYVAGSVKMPNYLELIGRSTSKWDVTGIGVSHNAFKFSSST